MQGMNAQKIIQYICYCVAGILVGMVLYFINTKLFTSMDIKVDLFSLAGIVGCGFGYLLARIRIISQNISICAATDPLTNMNNRIRFNEILDRETLRSNRHGANLSVILVDIDSFNNINKIYGRKAADSLLMRVSSIVKSVSRDVDICARWGGDEFIILLPDTDLAGAQITAERLRSTVEKEFIPVVGQVTISLGVAQFKPQKDLKETFIDRADSALYRVKQKGRNGVEVDTGEEKSKFK
jgi:diguanylate cyclase (GGDEF)-like protein